jgi:hypothetical protein
VGDRLAPERTFDNFTSHAHLPCTYRCHLAAFESVCSMPGESRLVSYDHDTGTVASTTVVSSVNDTSEEITSGIAKLATSLYILFAILHMSTPGTVRTNNLKIM